MARFGGLGVLPQDMDLDTVARNRHAISTPRDPRYDTTALAVTPRSTLLDVLGIIRKRAHDLVVVVDDEQRPVGIVNPTPTCAKPREHRYNTPSAQLMSSRVITVPAGTGRAETPSLLMEEARVKAVPVLDIATAGSRGLDPRRCGAASRIIRAGRPTPRGSSWSPRAVGISTGAATHAALLLELGVLGHRPR